MAVTLLLLAFWLHTPEAAPAEADSARQKTEACTHLYTETEQAQRDERYEVLPSLIRRTRHCYGSSAPRKRLMTLYFWKALALSKTARSRQAFAVFRDFFERFSAHPDSLWFRRMYHRRGYMYYVQGKLSNAVWDYTRALSYAVKDTTQAAVTDRAELSLGIGKIFQRMKAFNSALHYYQRADTLLSSTRSSAARKTLPRVRTLRAKVLLARADLMLENPGMTEASVDADRRDVIRRCKRALTLLGEDAAEESVLNARVLLVDAYGSLGDIAQARKNLARASALAQRQDARHWLFWLSFKRGRLYEKAGDLPKAEAALQDGFEMMDQARHDDYKRRLLTELGRVYELMDRPVLAEASYRRAIDVVEHYRAALGATEWAAQAFSQWQAPYRGLVRVLLVQGRPRTAFQALERARARHLRDLRTQARMLSTLNPSKRRRFDRLATALADVRDRLASDTLHSSSTRARLSRRETRLMAQRRALIPASAPQRDSLSIQALQESLGPRHRVLLSYFIDDDLEQQPRPGSRRQERPSRSTAFVVTHDRFAAVPLPHASADTLAALLNEVSPLLEGKAQSKLNAVNFALGPLNALYDRLLAPLQKYIGENDPLVIVPDGPLYALPFPALVAEATAPYQYRTAPFLLRRHPITTELAAALLLPATRKKTASPPPAAASRVDVAAFGKTHFEDLVASDAFQNSLFAADSLPALPAVGAEVEAVRRLFAKVRVARGGAATEPHLIDAMRHAKVLHIASHAFTSKSSPLQSAVLLSPSATGKTASEAFPTASSSNSDGLLHLHEIPHERLAARLVVLSGCSTARGVLRRGEGMAGLQYAFRSAGVPSTLSMLWPAEDHTAVQLMKRFYHHLRAGQPKDVALQKAQLALLDAGDPTRLSPFFWASPVLYGAADPLELAEPSLLARHRNAALGFVCCALLIAGTLLYRRFR